MTFKIKCGKPSAEMHSQWHFNVVLSKSATAQEPTQQLSIFKLCVCKGGLVQWQPLNKRERILWHDFFTPKNYA